MTQTTPSLFATPPALTPHDGSSAARVTACAGDATHRPRITRRLSVEGTDLLADDTLALILAGGRGTRLGALTAQRAKPAVPMAGGCRIIDFTLSNCLNSGIPNVGVLTQYQEHSLISHLRHAWRDVGMRTGDYVDLLPSGRENGYAGTADAIYQNRHVIRAHDPARVLILAGDHVYRMDYRAMLAFHVERQAQLTVGCIEVPIQEAQAFGVMDVDDSRRILHFEEKPPHPTAMPGRPDTALASMGIYVFDTGFLLQALADDARRIGSTRDFGKDVLPNLVAAARVYAYALRDPNDPGRPGYWRDVGTIDAYWRTNLELVETASFPGFVARAWSQGRGDPRAIRVPHAYSAVPAACAASGSISNSRIAGGARIVRSALFPVVSVGTRAQIEESVILPGATIGPDCIIRRAIIGEHCRLDAGTIIGVDSAHDREHYQVSVGGVVLVTANRLYTPDTSEVAGFSPSAVVQA